MALSDFRFELASDVQAINCTAFEHTITPTDSVPSLDDDGITFPNVSAKTQKSKLIHTAVLFVDMRGSTAMSMQYKYDELAPVYASFVRTMVKCAHRAGGRVRNIIGDRVMVVFDTDKCFEQAIDTAILMNSVVKGVLREEVKLVDIEAGIGIDYDQMLVTKNGVIKHEDENSSNKSLVWLGKPANVASKLTDMAGKMDDSTGEKRPPILFTKWFYDKLVEKKPEFDHIEKGYWKVQAVRVKGHGNTIMGGDVHYVDLI